MRALSICKYRVFLAEIGKHNLIVFYRLWRIVRCHFYCVDPLVVKPTQVMCSTFTRVFWREQQK